ncbi:DPP IV N-terminal domain-containing protein [Kribbella sp. NPDC056345]|uniref:DPP IV N-terminal domain-containing protein n=1 Tax=Kribbella sp. NPDC056345 TaxID=3345789 RepID=UPI0035DDFA07
MVHEDPTDPGTWSISRRRALQLSGGVAAAATASTTHAQAAPDEAAPAAAGEQASNHAVLDEGTNLMVAASPDGRWLAFDLVTAIWVTPAAGGVSRRLTDDLQDATRPRWSPDGRRIVFQSYRDGNFHLWSIDADGNNLRQLTTGRNDHREPHFTPDGGSIVFSSDRGSTGSYGIHRLDLASGAITALTDDPSEEAEPIVSPDGTKIAFTVDASSIAEVDLATGTRRTVVTAQTGSSVYGPAYSPTGQLAYVRLAGPVCDLVVGDQKVTSGKDVFAVPPSWVSADELVYTADGHVVRHRLGGAHTVVPFAATVPITSRRPRPKSPDLESTGSHPVLGIASPAVSPDGQWIAFRALNALWLAATNGRGKPRKIVADGYFNSDPDFAPDGKSLLYASDRDGTADLWLHDLKAGTNRKLSTLPGAQTAPRFSPDGKQVAYQDQDGIAWILDISTGAVRQVTPTLFQPGRVSWSADGGRQDHSPRGSEAVLQALPGRHQPTPVRRRRHRRSRVRRTDAVPLARHPR